MSFALRAAILVSVDAYAGTWCALPWIAGRVVRPQHEIKAICDEFVADHQMQHSVLPDGTHCYGVQCPVTEEVPLC